MTINIQYKTKSNNTYDFQIVLDDDDENEYTFLPQVLHPFQYGNDDKIDSILYPDSVKIEFSIYGAGINVNTGYYALINKLSFVDSEVIITKNGTEMMRGYIDQMDVQGNYNERAAEITILGNFLRLKTIDPRTLNPAIIADSTPVNGAEACAYFTKVITETVKLVMPNITETIFMSDLKATTTYTFLAQPYDAPAFNWGDFASRFWGQSSIYGRIADDPDNFNCAQLIKNILASFGCVGIVKDNQFIMQSRLYYQSALETIPRNLHTRAQPPRPMNQPKVDGLQVLVRPYGTSIYREALYGIVKKDENGILEEPDRVETLHMYVAGGDPPGVDGNIYPLLVRRMYVYIPGFVAGLGNEIWDLAKRNECYSSAHPTKGPVWKVVANSIWTDTSYDRLAYLTSVLGLSWQYNKFYKFADDPNAYRPRRMNFNEENYTTELDLLKMTDIAQEFEPETENSLRDINGILLNDLNGVSLYTAIVE